MPHLHILFSENDPYLWVENLSNSQSSKNQARYIEKNKLVGGWPTPLKNMKVSWGYYSQYMEK